MICMMKLLFVSISLLFVTTTSPADAATIKEGSACKKLNQVSTVGTSSFICLKSEAKLVLVPKFKKCADAIAAGRAPIVQTSDPNLYAANSGLDRDKDGTACDK